MKEKREERKDEEVQGIEMIDLGDAMEETRQGSTFPHYLDSCCSYTWLAE